MAARARGALARGSENSKPVRIGNAAVDQLQLDVFGEVMDALHHARGGRDSRPRGRVGVSGRAARNIWKRSGAPRRRHLGGAERTPAFHHSKVMAWVAFDRGIKAWRRSGSWARSTDGGGLARTSMKRSAGGRSIRICSFAQVYDSDLLDASRAADPAGRLFARPTIRVSEGTIEASSASSYAVDSCSIRLGRDPRTGCRPRRRLPSLQLLACRRHVLTGRLADARRLFERLTALCNDVGLLARI